MKGAVGNANDSQGRPPAPDGNANDSQVGGRQGALRLAPPGGGYQDVYTISGDALPVAPAPVALDPRIAELSTVGIPRVWIRVAREIGFDSFMAMWRILMQGGHIDERCRVVVPNYQRYLRFQRNRMIRQLIDDGHDVAEIRAQVKAATGEDVSESHIRRASQRA